VPDQVVTPEEAARQAQRFQETQDAERRKRKYSQAYNQIVGIAGHNKVSVPGIEFQPDGQGGFNLKDKAIDFGTGVLDLLQRGNFAAAGVAEELFVNKSGVLEALGRGASEIFSGVAGVQGQKETFRDVLDGLGLVNETELRAALPGVDDLPVLGGIAGSMNLRGTVGLALDIALDPVTWLTGGASAIAKVPKGTKLLRSATPRLTPVVEGATQGLTKKGVRQLAGAEDEALTALKSSLADGTRALPPEHQILWTEGELLAVQQVQEQFTQRLSATGVKLRAADKFSGEAVRRAISEDPADIFGLDELLQGLRPRNAARIKSALGLSDKTKRADIGAALKQQVDAATDTLVSQALDPLSPLGALAADVTRDRAMAAVIEQAKHTPGLMRDITPLRFLGRNIGPAGKSLTEWVVESGLTQNTLAAMNKVLPTVATKAGIASAGFVKRAYDFLGRNFNADWNARKLAGYNMMKAAHLQSTGLAVAKHHSDALTGDFGQWYQQVLRNTKGKTEARNDVFRKFAQAVDEGDVTKLQGLGDEALAAYGDFRTRMRAMAIKDVRQGTLKASHVRTNYFPHFVEGSDQVFEALQAARPGRKFGTQATIGRHAELRGFESIADLEMAAKTAGVEVGVLLDPMNALTKRAETSIEAGFWSDFQRSVASQFGERGAAVMDPHHLYDLTRQLSPEGSHAGRVAEKLGRAKKSPKLETIAHLADKHGTAAVGDFLRHRLGRIKGQAGVMAFMRKYENYMEALPKLRTRGLAPDGSPFVDMPGTFKEMRGYAIPLSAANDIREMGESIVNTRDMNLLLRSYDNFTNRIKLHLTAMFPGFHFRNAYSNVAQMQLDMGLGAINPVVHKRAALIAADLLGEGGQINLKRTPKMAAALRNTSMHIGGGRRVTLDDMRAEILRNGIARGNKDIFEATGDVGSAISRVPVQGMSNAKRLWGAWGRRGREAGTIIENEGRIALYLNLRKRGLSELEATQRVNRALFDYQSLTNFERQYLKRAIPFYVWSKKNVALQASAIRNNPGRLATQVKVLNNEDDEVTNVMAEWQQEGFRLQLDRDGKHVRMLTGIDLPITSIDRLLPVGQIMRGQGGEAFRQVVSQMTPIISVPASMMAGTELFSGRPLDRTRSDAIGRMLDPDNAVGKRIPEGLRRWMGYDKTTFRNGTSRYTFDGGKFNLLFRSWILSRWMSTGDRFVRDVTRGIEKDESWASGLGTAMLSMLTSLKDEEINLSEAELFKMKERKKKIEDALVRSGHGIRFDRVFQSISDPAKGRKVTKGRTPIYKVNTQGRNVGER
jgi:hypothetical protein